MSETKRKPAVWYIMFYFRMALDYPELFDYIHRHRPTINTRFVADALEAMGND